MTASSTRDGATLDFYARDADAYAWRDRAPDDRRLRAFAAAVGPGNPVLELGCGGGHDSVELLRLGLALTPTDGSPELAAQAATRLGRPVPVLLFEDIDAVAAYDGVWANACLLHVPRAGLPAVLERIHRALRPGGVFHASYKAGETEGHDRFGRFFNYPSRGWLEAAYAALPWRSVEIEEEIGGGYDGEPTHWLYLTAVRSA